VPTLFVNGQPHTGISYTAYTPSVKVFRDFARAGVDLFSFSATPTEAGYGLSRTAWVAPDQFDFSQLDERAEMVLEARPDAWIFPRLYLHAPVWWSNAHPDAVVMMDPGDGVPVPFIHAGGKPAPSWASEAWHADTITALEALVAHVESSPYGDHVIGYHLASGTTEEWMMWGGNEDQWVDYSAANLRSFRAWLSREYGSQEGLQEAWHRRDVTLETASIPTKQQRAAAHCGALRDPANQQQVIDYDRYTSFLVADTICTLAAAMKRITRRQKAVGVFYGYILQLCGEQRQQNAGHLALDRVLASPDVDFLCSPTSYAFRQVGGEGTSHFMSLMGSVQRHGKLWFNENDIRTSLTNVAVGQWGRPATLEGDLLQQDKELANALTQGVAQWWFDVGGNRYDHPELMACIAAKTGNAHQVLHRDRGPVHQIALVVDETSLCWLRVGDPMGRWLLVDQLPELHRVGAPVGHYLTEDLDALADQRLIVLPTSLAPSDEQRAAVNRLKCQGRVLVFLWCDGLFRQGERDPAAMAEFTGMTTAVDREPAPLRVTLGGEHAWMSDLRGVTYGVDQAIAPVAYADDPEATVLGRLPDGRPGLAMKQYADWTAVHSAAPLLPASLLRKLAERAGVHLYGPVGDVIWANSSMVAISGHEAGQRTLQLAQRATVTDLYTGQVVAQDANRLVVPLAERGTRVFMLDAQADS
jgi:beta-galactosidase